MSRSKFCEFVRAHRSPTGRTADNNGRFHGASFYLDSKWVVLRNRRNDGDTRPSFYFLQRRTKLYKYA